MCLRDHKWDCTRKCQDQAASQIFFSLSFAWGKLLEIIKLMFPSSFPLLSRWCYFLRITKDTIHLHTLACKQHRCCKWIIEVIIWLGGKKVGIQVFCFVIFCFCFVYFLTVTSKGFLARALADFMMYWNTNKNPSGRRLLYISVGAPQLEKGRTMTGCHSVAVNPPATMHSVSRELAAAVWLKAEFMSHSMTAGFTSCWNCIFSAFRQGWTRMIVNIYVLS